MDVFEVIVSFATTQTISRIARSCFVCYEVSMPILLDRIKIRDSNALSGAFSKVTNVCGSCSS